MASKKKPATTPRAGHGPLKVEYRKTDSLKPYAGNQRTHSPAQLDEIGRSIQAVGWTKPIIVDEKLEILAGHGAWMAAQQLGMNEVPTILRGGLTPAQKKAYRIADNRLAEKSTWDEKLLQQEMAALKSMGFDMSLTGFDQSEIEFMLQPTPPDPGEPPTPEIQKRVISKLGDMWLLGENRIICADSTKPETYKTLMGGRQAQCVFTDPPYGVSYQGRGLDSSRVDVIKGDAKRRGELKTLLTNALRTASGWTKEDAGWYIWHADKTRPEFAEAIRDVGLVENGMIIWEKLTGSMGWQDYRNAHEPCFYASKQGKKPAFHGDRTGTTVWRLESGKGTGEPTLIGTGLVITGPDGREIYLAAGAPKGKKVRHMHMTPGQPLLISPRSEVDDVWAVGRDTGQDAGHHPTQKPVELARRACRNSLLEGEIILDMFAGSGSTIMAAEQTKRLGYGIELDPHYVDAIVRRWQDATGKKATHAKEKKTFEAIAEARGKA